MKLNITAGDVAKILVAFADSGEMECIVEELAVDGDLDLSEMDLDDVTCEADLFETAGVMTNDDGLVLKIGRAEFQITIVRSK